MTKLLNCTLSKSADPMNAVNDIVKSEFKTFDSLAQITQDPTIIKMMTNASAVSSVDIGLISMKLMKFACPLLSSLNRTGLIGNMMHCLSKSEPDNCPLTDGFTAIMKEFGGNLTAPIEQIETVMAGMVATACPGETAPQPRRNSNPNFDDVKDIEDLVQSHHL
ncbi:uncharacterized protein LOC141902237 [Tubulanus polymorphus]|uniref:uncharacterized protein LOC141902237 n=1 Tax=Tubulanus polymorphus TaxID=672921 RepID=UPI003DA543F3